MDGSLGSLHERVKQRTHELIVLALGIVDIDVAVPQIGVVTVPVALLAGLWLALKE